MKVDVAVDAPVYLVTGDDEVLMEDTVVELVHALVGEGDRGLVVEELDHTRYEDDDGDIRVGPVVDAARTPPFLTDQRVVVARHACAFAPADRAEALVDYLADPLPSTRLVLVWERVPKQGQKRHAVPKKLSQAVKKAGGVTVAVGPPKQGKAAKAWFSDHLAGAAVRFDAGAQKLIADTVGEDVGRLVGLLPTLEATFGPGATLTADDVAPYLGEQGGVKPWDLTDAIDGGDVGRSVEVLHRMMGAGGMAGLQIMATLTRHYTQMLTLDGLELADGNAAGEVLGISGFPAKKALDGCRRLGHDRLVEFLGLLAQADLDLRGAKQYPGDVRDELIMEVLVARLASRTPGRSRRR